MFLGSVEFGCSFKKGLFCYKSTQRRQFKTKCAFSLLKKDEFVIRQQLFNNVPFQSTK